MAEPSTVPPQTTQESPQALCSMCHNATASICNICRCTRYCFKVCQNDDWAVHKLLCKTYQDFATPLSPTHFRGILFSDNEKKPRSVWIRITRDLEGNEPPKEGSVYSVHFENLNLPPPGSLSVATRGELQQIYRKTYNRTLKRSHDTIAFYGFLRRDEHGDETIAGKQNTSLQYIDAELVATMRGCMVYHGTEGHLEMLSFRHIIDELRMGFYIVVSQQEKQKLRHIRGGRVDCLGDVRIGEQPAYESARVGTDFFDMERIFTVPAAAQIGPPLEIHMYGEPILLRDRHFSEAYTDLLTVPAMKLNPALWRTMTGSLLVIR
jgi:hypothetical protein